MLLNSMRNTLKKMSYSKSFTIVILLVIIYELFPTSNLETVYKHYNIVQGHNEGLTLSASQEFLLNGKPLNITSGAIHYFRVHPNYWRDRLRKLRASGAIALKTAVPWNLHEPYRDIYDFGSGGFEMSPFLDVVKFIQTAREEDLLVILSLGPYVNEQLDFGGLPSYLLGEGVKVRTSDPRFLARVEKYYSKLLPLLAPLQIQHGGPIVMFQLENSYGSIRDLDKEYLRRLKKLVLENGIKALLYTSDPVSATLDRGSLTESEVLLTTNSEGDVLSQLETLRALNPNSPALIHFRSGFVDFWSWKSRNMWPASEFEAALREVAQFPASICLHMFHGGTNFGFLSGATLGDTPDSYYPHTTSFDVDASLTEAGEYTDKYEVVLELFKSLQPHLLHPSPPLIVPRTCSLSIPLCHELLWADIISQLPDPPLVVDNFVYMEDLPVVDGKKQSFGYVRYSLDLRFNERRDRIRLLGRKRDIAIVLVDGKAVGTGELGETNQFGFWDSNNDQLDLNLKPGVHRIELLLENCGRPSHSQDLQWLMGKKGLGPENSLLFRVAYRVGKINITGMPFLAPWVTSLSRWRKRVCFGKKSAPSLLKSTFLLTREQISDTFLDISEWGKGVVFVNGFNIGRYFCNSPQQTLYIPAPLLHVGENEIIIFEHYINPHSIELRADPIFS